MDPRLVQYLVQQPTNLEKLALVKLAEWITLQGMLHEQVQIANLKPDPSITTETLTRQIEVIRNVIECNVPGVLHDKLIVELLRTISEMQRSVRLKFSTDSKRNETNALLRILETLFTKKLTTLVLDYASINRLRKVLFSKAHLISGLVRLELEYTHVHIGLADENDIMQMLKSLPNLRHFKFEKVCTNNILRCLMEHCKLIENLNLMFSSDVNDDSISILSQFNHLRNINLSDTSVTKLGMAQLLKSCKNIEVIENCWSNTIAQGLEHIIAIEKYAKMEFKLKYYSKHPKTTYKQLKLVLQMCPRIQKLQLDTFKMKGILDLLENLQSLQELILENFEFYTDHVKEILELRGPNLVHLRLINIDQLNLHILIDICQMCQNLETLNINCTRECTLHDCTLVRDKYQSQNTVPEILTFRNLKTLVFHVVESQSRSFDTELLFLLSNSPNLEFISTSVSVNDDIMSKILDKNPLLYLQKLKMLRSNLAAPVIERIYQNGISRPIVINYTTFFIPDGNES